MKHTTLIAGFFGVFALAGAALASPTDAVAAQTLPADVAHQLDRQDAQFTMTAAKRRLLMMMESINRQQRYSNRRSGHGYGARPGYGYGERPGYGGGPDGDRAGYRYRRY